MKNKFFLIVFGCLCLVLVANYLGLDSSKQPVKNAKEKPDHLEEAVVAGGCFWCVEASLEKLDGVFEAISGYAGGSTQNPSYREVSRGVGGHLEVVKIQFDPTVISYTKLLDAFWRLIDPTDGGGSFVDRGTQYTSAIFYKGEEQKKAAEKSKSNLENSKKFSKPIVTEIRPLTNFYRAEDYHQDYYLKNPWRYKRYRSGSGRDQFIEKVWGADSQEK